MNSWQPPSEWDRIKTIDAHTAGEPFRVIIEGTPELEGETILERRRFARENLDSLRRTLMWEPRGHADMYGCLVTDPVSVEADLGVIFMHNEGYSTMCGHGIIGLVTVALETGMIPIQGAETRVGLDTPAGFVQATAYVEGARVTRVRFVNVPSFPLALDQELEVEGLGRIKYDLAFGGAFYAYVTADQAKVGLTERHFRELIERGIRIKAAVNQDRSIEHPLEPELSFLYGTIFTGQPSEGGLHSRNVCVFADGEVDRCPTGTGVSGRLALDHARRRLSPNEWIEIESIIGTRFRGRIIEETKVADLTAVVPEVEGSAFITGRHEFLIDPRDPLKNGFLLR
ncbi:MAG: proline racemase family protein [Anaerolineales bacterium]